MIIRGNADFFKYLKDNLKDGDSVDIVSYGMYLSITDKKDFGMTYPIYARAFADLLNSVDHRIVIGIPFYWECVSGCRHCINKRSALIRRFEITQRKLGLSVRYESDLHLKYYRVGKRVFTGGINWNNSRSIDIAVEVKSRGDKKILSNLFEHLWARGKRDACYYAKKGV